MLTFKPYFRIYMIAYLFNRQYITTVMHSVLYHVCITWYIYLQSTQHNYKEIVYCIYGGHAPIGAHDPGEGGGERPDPIINRYISRHSFAPPRYWAFCAILGPFSNISFLATPIPVRITVYHVLELLRFI